MTDSVEQPLTVREAARALGLSENSVRSRIRSGEIKADRVETPQGPIYLIQRSSLRLRNHRGSPPTVLDERGGNDSGRGASVGRPVVPWDKQHKRRKPHQPLTGRNILALLEAHPRSSAVVVRVAPPTVLALLSLFFFHNVLIGNSATFPWDFTGYHVPATSFVGRAIRSGQLPLWTPNTLLGYPIGLNPQSQAFYPIYAAYDLITALPPFGLRTLEIMEVLHIVAAGVFTYALARAIGLGRASSMLAGLVFALGGQLPMQAEHETIVATEAWIPLLLLLTIRLLEKRTLAFMGALALAFGMAVLAGFPQTIMWIGYFLFLFLVWQSVPLLRLRQYGTVLRDVLRLGFSLMLGAGIAAITLLPATQLALNSVRAGKAVSFSANGLLSGAPLTLVLPKIFQSNVLPAVLPAGDPTLTQIYLGILPLILLLVAIFTLPAGRHAHFFRLVAIVGFIGSFGTLFPLYKPFELLPFATRFRDAYTLLPFAVLGAAMLCGQVFERLLSSRLSRGDQRRLLAALGLAVTLAGICFIGSISPETLQGFLRAFHDNAALLTAGQPGYGEIVRHASVEMLPFIIALGGILGGVLLLPRVRPVLGILLVVLTFADLYTSNANQNFDTAKRSPDSVFTARSVDGIQVPGIDRIRAATHLHQRIAFNNIGGDWSSASYVLGWESMTGFDVLALKKVYELIRVTPSINSRLFGLFNVRYLVTSRDNLRPAGSRQSFSAYMPAIGLGDFYLPPQWLDPHIWIRRAATTFDFYQLWENRQVLPRSFAVTQVRVVPNADQRLSMLGSANFDPARTAILEQPVTGKLSGTLAAPVAIVKYNNDAFDLKARVRGGRVLLVISTPNFPGWSATVDGKSTPIWTADHAFMALPLSPGTHAIHLAFLPATFIWGVVITVLSIIASLYLLCARRLTRSWRARQAGS